MFYELNGLIKDLINKREVYHEVEEYEDDGIIFLIEDGEIKGMGKE